MKFLLIFIMLQAPMTASAKEPELTDDMIRKNVVGTWIVDKQRPGVTLTGADTIVADGSFYSKVTLTRDEKKQEISNRGTWEVKGGQLIETLTHSDYELLPIGVVTSDKIIKVDENEIVYLTEAGETVTRKRAK